MSANAEGKMRNDELTPLDRLSEVLVNHRYYTPAELGQVILTYVRPWEALAELARLRAVEERVNDAVQAVRDWRDKAYPLDIFPEPDMKQVRELLGEKLITLVSASNMRHVTTRVCEILAAALNKSERP